MILKTNEKANQILSKIESWWITDLVENVNFEKELKFKIVFFEYTQEDEFKEMIEFIDQVEDYLGI